MLKYRCVKVRDTVGAYTDPTDKKAMPVRAFHVHFTPVESQHEVDSGVLDLKLTVMHVSPYQEGQTYDI